MVDMSTAPRDPEGTPSAEGMPTFLIIGAAKSGTTSLHRYLDLHPQFSMSSFKEPAFFLRHEAREVHRFQIRDRSRFLALFDARAPFRGESSVRYSWWPLNPGAPAAVAAEVPEMKFVYLVRDPVDRAVSQFVQLQVNREREMREGFRGKTLSEALREPEPHRNALIAPGLYMTQIRQYLDYFPRDSILVLDSDDLRKRRSETVSEVIQFLGADPLPSDVNFGIEHNAVTEKRQEADAYIRLTESRLLRGLVDRVPRSARDDAVARVRRLVSRPLSKPELDPAERHRLEEIFRQEVEELREFTGKSFSSWSV